MNNSIFKKMKVYIAITFVLPMGLFSQNLPDEMYFSSDGHILYTGVQNPSGLYDKTSVKTVYLNFAQSNYWTLLTNNYASETNIPATMIYDGTTLENVGVRFRGNTSYMQIGSSQKKSFAIETDFVNPDLEILGYNDLKFNNAHQDPTFMREVLYNRMAVRHTPIAKGNYIHLYINNQDWGLYANIQSPEKKFLKEWFQSNDGARFRATTENTGTPNPNWGDGTAGMNYISSDTLAYKNYYSLKSSEVGYPWQKLLDACYALSQSSATVYATLKNKIDIDKALWFLAVENIFTDDDSYIMKGKMDYMVYYEPETGRTIPLEYDGNSTFQTSAATSSNWNPFKNATNANYPLLYKLLNIPEYRQRYLAHYRTILNETFTTTNANALIDEIHAQIGALVAADPKKLYTTAEYTSGYPLLKTFVANRRTFLLSNTEVAQVAPVIASAPYYNSSNLMYVDPVGNEPVTVKASVTSSNGISKVNLYYATGLVGNFNAIQMYDDGSHNDNSSGDGIFGATIPGYASGTFVRYYIEAVANNTAKSVSYLPTGAEHDIFVYTVTATTGPNGVVINEIMAQNTSTVMDENSQYEDWIELYNNNNYSVDLSGFYLTDDATNLVKWQIPSSTSIEANGFLIVWADEDLTEGPLHADFKLSASGETVILSDVANSIVDQIDFGVQTANMGYARVPNGTGSFVIQSPTYNANNDGIIGVEDIHISEDFFSFYPNPVASVLHLKFSDQGYNKEVNILNTMGQILQTHTTTQNLELNVESLSSGIYFIKCENTVEKFIKL
jgi:hypothetical protein